MDGKKTRGRKRKVKEVSSETSIKAGKQRRSSSTKSTTSMKSDDNREINENQDRMMISTNSNTSSHIVVEKDILEELLRTSRRIEGRMDELEKCVNEERMMPIQGPSNPPIPPPTMRDAAAMDTPKVMRVDQEMMGEDIGERSTRRKDEDSVLFRQRGMTTTGKRKEEGEMAQEVLTLIDRLKDGREEITRDSDDARMTISELLRESGPTFNSKRGMVNFQPFKFIVRGEKCYKIGPGEANMAEYLSAIYVMMDDALCPLEWRPFMRKHIEEVTIMGTKWEWHICRRWSERIFKLLAEGRLKGGWSNEVYIKDLQRDYIALGQRNTGEKYGRNEYFRKGKGEDNIDNGYHVGRTYEKEKDGKPCYAWNWGRDCGNKSGPHGVGEERSLHICAWCAYRYRAMNNHAEKDCNNKRRYVDRRGEAGNEQNFR